MDRRSFLGSLAAILGLGAGAALAKPASKLEEIAKNSAPITPHPPVPCKEASDRISGEIAKAVMRRDPWKDLLDPPQNTFALRAIGVTCPKCGEVGNGQCKCGWSWSQMFVDNGTPRTDLQSRPLGY